MNRVLIFGTFDLLHPGHRSFIRQAKRHGDHLTVVVGRDEVVRRLKKRWPTQTMRERMAALRLLPNVNKVVAGMPKDYLLHLRREQPDVICLGYDQTHFTGHLREDLDRLGLTRTRIVRLKPYRPDRYKSSLRRSGVRHSRAKKSRRIRAST